MILIKNLYKAYGSTPVLSGLNLSIEKGITVIYGRNGAGKTTFLKILTGIEAQDSGSVEIKGEIGYMPQEPALYEEYRVSDYILLVRSMGGRWMDLKELLHKLRIGENISTWKLSYGMKKSLYLSVILTADTDVYLLDEPFMGIDKYRREVFMDFIERNMEEKTILMVESEEILPPTYVLEGGRIIEAKS
jgi:ABC-2 type transport system ATP-binding protein